MTSPPPRQIHLAAHFPGVNNTTVWSDPASGSHIDFASFEHLARTAERAKFDFLFLAEGLRMREHAGRLHELDVAGRPDGLAVLSALAAVTEHLGLMATITTTYHEPYELARQLASLDHLSCGRAGWNLVTSSDAFTGENFRRGAYLPYDQRYERGEQFVAAANAMWDSWANGDAPGRFALYGSQVQMAGEFTVPVSPQRHPAMPQAGDSEAGREFAAKHADGIFTRHGKLEDGLRFYADVKGRLARYSRTHEDLVIMPGSTFIIGDTDEEALEIAHDVRRAQVSGPHAIMFLEQLWNRTCRHTIPTGRCPTSIPTSTPRPAPRAAPRHGPSIARRWRPRRSGAPAPKRAASRSASWRSR
jgi:alkanesulfonate monooxygenase SsuD/methylene tetrahydromethanopterin reductase-like flavin-dependent oxidoreductase (luciferase family)